MAREQSPTRPPAVKSVAEADAEPVLETGPIESGPAEASRLRAAIDSGETRDKVAAEDPAAAPLGTDDEAAGSPPGASRAGRALRQEVRIGETAPADAPRTGGAPWALITLAAIVVIAALAFIFIR